MSQDFSATEPGNSIIATLAAADTSERIYFSRAVGAVTVQFNDAAGRVGKGQAGEGVDMGNAALAMVQAAAVAFPLTLDGDLRVNPSLFLQTALLGGEATLILDRRV